MISTVTQRLTEVGQVAPVRAYRAAMDKMVDSIRSTLKAEIWMTCLEICSAACSTANPDRSSPARAIGRILEVDSAELMVTARASAARQAAAIPAGLAARPAMVTLAVLTASILAAAATAALAPLKEARICALRSASALTKRHLAAKKKISLQGQDGKISTVQVKIPAGIESGKTIRLRGKGMPGSNSAGDGTCFEGNCTGKTWI